MPPTKRLMQSRIFVYAALITAFLLGALLAGFQGQTTGAPITADADSASTELIADEQ